MKDTKTHIQFLQLQVADRKIVTGDEDEDADFSAFSFSNDTDADDRVCPLDSMEWQLKVRNQAMKKGCSSVQMDGLKKALYMIRVVVNTIVQVYYMILQMAICLMRLVIPITGETAINQIITELNFWFNKLLLIVIEAVKQLANLLFNLIFTSGPLGTLFKFIVEAMCKIIQFIIWIWNETACQLLKPVVIPFLRYLANLLNRILSFLRLIVLRC
jgi:hypothetical protein